MRLGDPGRACPPGALPEPNPDLTEILADLGQRYNATLKELDQTIAEAEAVKAAVPEPGVLVARAVEALAKAIDGMTASMTAQAVAQAAAKPTVRHVVRDANGDILRIIDEPLDEAI